MCFMMYCQSLSIKGGFLFLGGTSMGKIRSVVMVATLALTFGDGDTTSRQGLRLAQGMENLAKVIDLEAFYE